MRTEVVEAMVEASRSYVRLPELLEKAGQRVAELAGVEAAYITTGVTLSVGALATAPVLHIRYGRYAQLRWRRPPRRGRPLRGHGVHALARNRELECMVSRFLLQTELSR